MSCKQAGLRVAQSSTRKHVPSHLLRRSQACSRRDELLGRAIRVLVTNTHLLLFRRIEAPYLTYACDTIETTLFVYAILTMRR